MAGLEMRADLARLVGQDHVLVDDDLRAGHERDWTGRFVGRACAVVRPGTTDDVAAVVSWCAERGVPIVPQGGNTGLVGGGVPDGSGRSVVMSLRRLDKLGPLDATSGQVTAGAGVTLGALQAHLSGSAWEFGVDLGARDQATLGGMVATNAGGTRVLRYGTMRTNVIGVEAVLGDGSVVSHLGGLVKDNTGYDLAGLLCGSEGTLGIVTAARLRLVPRWPDRAAVWIACDGWAQAVELASRLRSEVEGLDALEAVDEACAALLRDERGVAPLFDPLPPVGLLAVWAGRGSPPESLVRVVGDASHVVALDAGSVRRFWEAREAVTETISLVGAPHKLDVTFPLAALAEGVDRIRRRVDQGRLFLFGHLGDGNLHVNVVAGPGDLDERVLEVVAGLGGSISAEHGIGRHKARWLHLARTPAEVAAFGALKRALDPAGIMNPGVLLSA